MKILVTGSSGMVGKPTVQALKDAGHEVVTYDLKDNQNISDAPLLRKKANGCDVVIHLAGHPHPIPTLRWPNYFTTNVIGTHNVVEAAVSQGVPRIIFSSSTAYYGAHRGFPFKAGRGGVNELSENAVQRYMTAEMPEMNGYEQAALSYACSKVAAETVLASYGLSRQIEAVVLRFSPLMATRKPYEFGLLLYLENAVAALLAAVDMPLTQTFEVYNIANDDVTAVNTGKAKTAGLLAESDEEE